MKKPPKQKKSKSKRRKKPGTKAAKATSPKKKPSPKRSADKGGSAHIALPPLRRGIQEKIRAALGRLGNAENALPILLEYAREEKFGDYACTTAMDKRWRDALAASKPEYQNPQKVAQDLQVSLGALSPEIKSEIAGPGFLNLTLDPAVFFEYAKDAAARRGEYGRSSNPRSQKIIFEYVSANPTGPLNVVSARAAALGDSCCNLLEAAGHTVYREYYVNDYGNQVNLLGQSCLLRELEARGVPLRFAEKGAGGPAIHQEGPGLPFPAEGYHGDYIKDVMRAVLTDNPHLAPSDTDVERALAAAMGPGRPDSLEELGFSASAEALGLAATDFFLQTHKRDLESFRVHFSGFFRERTLHDDGSVMAARQALSGHTFREEGREVFRSTAFGDDKDRVIVRDDGRPTYLLADIAYHKTKIDRGYDKLYNIWGPDHHGYIKRLAGALQALGVPSDRFRVLIAQQVNILDGGQPMVMSKRTGRFVTMQTLVEEIPIDVIRYFFALRSFDSHLDFDFAAAKDTSDKNPYYYVAYAHARIRSIVAKAAERGLFPMDPQKKPADLGSLEMTPERRRLLWLVARFPDEVADAAESLEPHRLTTFLYQLAGALQRFYAPKENRVIAHDRETAAVLLTILDAVSVCLKNGLALLGMEAPDRMHREAEEET